MINAFLKALIRLGKIAPFVLCFIVCVSYMEDVYALFTNSYMEFADGVYLYKPISWAIGNQLEYNISHLLVLCVLSIAISTCLYNKLACAYLGINLAEKSYFDFELEPTAIYIICLANIVVAGYLTYKGIKILIQHE